MASKKKLPISRRSRNQDLSIYILCHTNKLDVAGTNIKLPWDERDRLQGDSLSSETSITEQRYSQDNDVQDDLLCGKDKVDTRLCPRKNISQSQEQLSDHDEHYAKPVFGFLDVLFSFSSILFFFFDVVTDIVLARDYYYQRNAWAFGLTATFIVGPAVITCILNFRWYWLDYTSQQMLVKNYGKQNVKQTSYSLWLIRFIATILMMGPVMRQLEYIYNGIKSNSKKVDEMEKKRHYNVMRMEDVDASCIRMFECFLEAAPQLVLQIYILVVNKQKESWITESIRGLSILSSWGSLSWSLVAYQMALRFSHEDKQNITFPGMIFSFLWRVCEIGPRVIALGLFASLFNYVVFVVVGVHWIIMSVWLICQKTKFYEHRCEERFFNIVCGYVHVFCFLNVRDGRTRYRMLLYYIIFYIENWTMIGFWFYFTNDKSKWFYLPTFFIVLFAAFLQAFFQLSYYACFHPLGRGKIPCCLDKEHEKYSCFQSLCHDLETGPNKYKSDHCPTSVPV